MSDLLSRYGIKPQTDKSFSISFIDEFLDCSYRSYLIKMLKVGGPKVNANQNFGSGVHAGLSCINRIMLRNEEELPCVTCNHPCNVNGPNRKQALDRTLGQCKIKQMMFEAFHSKFNEEVKNQIILNYIAKGKPDEGPEEVASLEGLGPSICNDIMFRTQPQGTVLMVEQRLVGKIGPFPMGGIVDLVLDTNDKAILYDYKTRGTYPKKEDFPSRQFAVYCELCRQMGLKLDGIATIYAIKKDPPKRPRKDSPPHRYSEAHYIKRNGFEATVQKTVKQLEEEMDSITGRITNELFSRNKNSFYCPCEAKEFCEDQKKLDEFMEKQIVKESPECQNPKS